MNWGTKIIIGLGTFMLLIVSAGIYMVSSDTDTLIDNNYYENSLSYDKMYERKKNLLDDHAKPIIKLEGDTLFITFAKQNNTGVIVFRRLADAALDRSIPFHSVAELLKLPISMLQMGSYSVEVTWDNKGRSYYAEQSIYIK